MVLFKRDAHGGGGVAGVDVLSLQRGYADAYIPERSELRQNLEAQGVDFDKDWATLANAEGARLLREVEGLDGSRPGGAHSLDGGYVLTVDNLLKMLSIQLRLRARLPVVVMGETGCGKSSLVRNLCKILGAPLHTLNVHGGMGDREIVAGSRRAARRAPRAPAAARALPRRGEHVLAMALFKEVVIDRCLDGRPLPDSVALVAACNPPPARRARAAARDGQARLRAPSGGGGADGAPLENVGTGIKDPLRDPYRVHPLPEHGLIHATFARGRAAEAVSRSLLRPFRSTTSTTLARSRPRPSACTSTQCSARLGEQRPEHDGDGAGESDGGGGGRGARAAGPRRVRADGLGAARAAGRPARPRAAGGPSRSRNSPTCSRPRLRGAGVPARARRRRALGREPARRRALREGVRRFGAHLHAAGAAAAGGRSATSSPRGRAHGAIGARSCSRSFCPRASRATSGASSCRRSPMARPAARRTRPPAGGSAVPAGTATRRAAARARGGGGGGGAGGARTASITTTTSRTGRSALAEPRAGRSAPSSERPALGHMHVGDGIALNEALCENLFMIVVATLNQIPIFVIGKPGSSKSLAMALASANLNGDASADAFLRALPAVEVFPYQCSPLSTSDGIEQTFESARRYRRESPDTVVVVLLDEVGLAEQSPHLPLKVLHKVLDEAGPMESVVGISNWSLDPAKMNRAVHLYRPAPTVDDLSVTAEGIVASANLKGYLHALAVGAVGGG